MQKFPSFRWKRSHINSLEAKNIFEDSFADLNVGIEFDFIVMIEDIPVIINFDGAYFHGLDRPIADIAKGARKYVVTDSGKIKPTIDHTTFYTYYRDRTFEDYCQKRNIPLIRFNDSDFEKHMKKNELPQCHFTCGSSDLVDSFFDALESKEELIFSKVA